MAKRREKKVRMQSEASAYYYTAEKKSNHPEKLRFRSYDPIVRKHVWFDEKKLAKAS
jgi:large subunit ribosomal protein L33